MSVARVAVGTVELHLPDVGSLKGKRHVLKGLKDPRLGFVTVTEVDTTADLKLARVYVSVLGPDEQWTSSFKALESARGFVWNWLRKHLDLRATPQLVFRPDRSMEHAAHIQALLAGLKSSEPGSEE